MRSRASNARGAQCFGPIGAGLLSLGWLVPGGATWRRAPVRESAAEVLASGAPADPTDIHQTTYCPAPWSGATFAHEYIRFIRPGQLCSSSHDSTDDRG